MSGNITVDVIKPSLTVALSLSLFHYPTAIGGCCVVARHFIKRKTSGASEIRSGHQH